MARDLRLNIQGDSSSADKAFASATAALEKTSRELKTAEARTDALAVKARKLAEAEERAADKARDLAAKTAALRKEIEETGDETGQLGKKLERLARDTKTAALATDDYRRSADRAAENAREQARAYDKVADNAREAARAVAVLGAVSGLSPNGKSGGGGKGGGIFGALNEFSAGFLKGGFGGATSALEGTLGTPVVGPALLAGGAAAAVPAASFIGGAAGGGVLAGLGAAGAGLGLAGAWMGDPDRFDAMWSKSIDNVRKRWHDSSAAFGNELEAGLKVADTTLRNLPIEKVLALSQSFVAPLAAGAGQGLTGFANGFADALEHVQPVIDKLGPALANLGDDLGDTLRIISEGSEGGADALSDLVSVIGYTAKATGVLILGFEKSYESIRNFAVEANTAATTLPGVGIGILALESKIFHIGSTSIVTARQLGTAGDAAHDTAFDWGEMGAAAAKAAVDAIGLNDALTDLRNTQLASANVNLAVAQGWLDLSENLKEGAKSLDTNTQAGIDNVRGIQDQIGLLEQQREQAIKTGGGTETAIAAANAAYDAQIAKLRAAAVAAGFDKDKVDALIASLGAVPANTTANVQVSGLEKAVGQGISLGNALNNIDGFTAHAAVSFSAINTWVLDAARNAGAHARGGTFPTSGPKKVGEHGTELIWGSRGQYVSTAEETRKLASMAGSASSGGGSSAVGLRVMPGSDPLVGQLVQHLIDRGYVQAFAGGQPVTARRS